MIVIAVFMFIMAALCMLKAFVNNKYWEMSTCAILFCLAGWVLL